MQSRNRLFAVVTLPVCAAILLVGAWLTNAGDLNPPAGSIAPTMKTLVEVEPRIAVNAANTPGDADSLFKISQPGSYYLAGNVSGVAGKHGIEVAAHGVTLDLNGYDIAGVAGMGAFDGVTISLIARNITVVDGSIRNWGDDGVDMAIAAAGTCRVTGVIASGNGGMGINAGTGGTVSNCSASHNVDSGIVMGVGFGLGGPVVNCSSNNNGGHGILTGSGSTISNCSAFLNTGNGISVYDSSTVSNCSAYMNDSHGFSTSDGLGCTFSNCTAYDNVASGFNVHVGCTVVDCTARANTGDGIFCNSSCVIRGNTCATNGAGGFASGINVLGADNRIEGNNCTLSDNGINVQGAGNIVIRNTCSGNTINWDIAADNVCGPILDRTAPASAAILGDSAPDSTGGLHPNANFTF